MLEYYCKTCRLLFENSLTQTRCVAFKCLSDSIKDITPTVKGVTYKDFENWIGESIMSDDTKAGQVDDDALKRAKANEAKKQAQLKKIFDDNTTGRYGKGTDD